MSAHERRQLYSPAEESAQATLTASDVCQQSAGGEVPLQYVGRGPGGVLG
jgi:hypothetical protein